MRRVDGRRIIGPITRDALHINAQRVPAPAGGVSEPPGEHRSSGGLSSRSRTGSRRQHPRAPESAELPCGIRSGRAKDIAWT